MLAEDWTGPSDDYNDNDHDHDAGDNDDDDDDNYHDCDHDHYFPQISQGLVMMA